MSWSKEKIINESIKFDQAAQIYDEYRPSYPKEMIDTIINKTGINQGDQIIEIGAGSGKATELFVDKGYSVTCVELGKQLAEVGISKFAESGRVDYIIGRFEEIQNLPISNKLAFSAQAFHWILKPLGYQRLAEVLGEDGYCALFWNRYYDDKDISYIEFNDVCRKYNLIPLMDQSDVNDVKDREINALNSSKCFKEISYYEYPWQEQQTLNDFLNFLKTTNSYIGMDENRKAELYNDLVEATNKIEGIITRKYICTLFLMKKL